VDVGREAQQNRADVEMGLKTLSDHYAELGADFGEVIDRRATEAKRLKYGVPLDNLWKPSSGPCPKSILVPRLPSARRDGGRIAVNSSC